MSVYPESTPPRTGLADDRPHVQAQELAQSDVARPVAPPAVANPAPLGLAAFAATTLILSTYNTGKLSAADVGIVLPMALFYGGLAQLLAGMWEFRAGNTFGAVAFSSYGAFWLSFWGIFKAGIPLAPAGANDALALYLTVWGIITTYLMVAAMRTNGAVLTVFVLLAITFWLLAIGDWTVGSTPSNWTKAGGWVGIATAGVAFYTSFAEVTNATWGRTVLPVVPLNVARAPRRQRIA